MSKLHKRYVWILILCFGITLPSILVLNLILVNSTLEGHENTKLASQWQQVTHGVVSAPSVVDTSYFKLLRLHDRLPDINTVVFGASTSYGIEQGMFPPSMRIYNISQNGISLGGMIGEAEYLLEHDPNVKWFVIPLDWSVGFIYETGTPSAFNLDAALQTAPPERATWLEKIRDSLSYPRIVGLFRALQLVLLAEHKYATFHQIFLQESSDEYTCADGSRAKDYDLQSRGHCRGFRDDGSWTFNSMDRVDNAQRLIMLSLASDSKYTHNLLKTAGVPNPEYLRHMAALAHKAEQRGGGAIFFLPPLLSGMEHEFTQHPKWSGYLATTKQALSGWARDEHLILFDAGQSEKFGCTPDEFTDEHHATQACYRKVFSSFWQNSAVLNKVSSADPDVRK